MTRFRSRAAHGVAIICVTTASLLSPVEILAQPPESVLQQKLLLNEVKALITKTQELKKAGKLDEAEKTSLQTIDILEKQVGPDQLVTAAIYLSLADLYSQREKYTEAEPMYRKALAGFEESVGLLHDNTSRSLNSLGSLCFSQGRYEEAAEHFYKAHGIVSALHGDRHESSLNVVTNLAVSWQKMGRYSDVEPMLEHVLKTTESEFGVEHPKTASAVMKLASLQLDQGRHAAAVELYLRAIRIREQTLGDDHSDTAESLNDLAVVYHLQGDLTAAERLIRGAIKIHEKVFGPDHPAVGAGLNTLGVLYAELGNDAAAEPLYKKAIQIYERSFGADHPETAGCLRNLATLYVSQKKYAAAEPLFSKAIQICDQRFGPDHPKTAMSLNEAANGCLAAGNYDAAVPLLKRALSINENAFGPDHPRITSNLNNLAGAFRAQGNSTVAAELYLRASEIHRKNLGLKHPDTLTVFNNLARSHAESGRLAEAIETYDEARRGTREHVTKVLPSLPEQEQTIFLEASYRRPFHEALSLALQENGTEESQRTSATWLMNGKAVAQEALAQRNLLTRDLSNAALKDLALELQQVRKHLATLAMSVAETAAASERQEVIANLTAREQRLTHELNAAGGGSQSPETTWLELEQIQNALPAESVLIDIARFGIFDFNAAGNESRWQPPRYAAWITHKTAAQAPVLVDLGPAAELDALIETVRDAIQNASAADGAVSTEGEESAATALHDNLRTLADQIWKPLARHMGEATEIVLSPDGALWLMPWAAMPVSEESDEYVIERYTLRFVTSARDLVAKPDDRTANAPVILANPLFDQEASDKQSSIQAIFNVLPEADDTTTRSFSAKSLLPRVPALPGTGIEALAIQPNMEKFAGRKSILYKERYALERVAKALKSPQVAAFATHGFFLPKQETKVHDLHILSSNDTRSVALDTDGKPIENPLLRCGLLLAGCNNRDATVGDDDGILTGMEIVSIDFRGTELVVLSACETGIGDLRNGEGVAGLRQAFQLAGAEAVVATLWQVPDRDSALLMSKFFEELAAGKSKSEALRAAQLERIKSRRERFGAAHPFFWAAFTLTGN